MTVSILNRATTRVEYLVMAQLTSPRDELSCVRGHPVHLVGFAFLNLELGFAIRGIKIEYDTSSRLSAILSEKGWSNVAQFHSCTSSAINKWVQASHIALLMRPFSSKSWASQQVLFWYLARDDSEVCAGWRLCWWHSLSMLPATISSFAFKLLTSSKCTQIRYILHRTWRTHNIRLSPRLTTISLFQVSWFLVSHFFRFLCSGLNLNWDPS